MKLYVDDLRKCPDGWVLARTVTEAIRILATQDVTHVSLDHDISHSVEVNGLARPYPCGETFEPVAWYIAVQNRLFRHEALGHSRRIPCITIHTANPVGAEKMRAILREEDCIVMLGRPVNGLESQ